MLHESRAMPVRPLVKQLAALSSRTAFGVAAWWLLSEGDASSWKYGIPIVALAVAARTAVAGAPPPRISPWGSMQFLAAFISGMVRGGVDVARRALSVRMPISPGWLMYDVRLSASMPRRLLMMAVSVMPGTYSVDLEDDVLRLHVLTTDAGDELLDQVRTLERSIAKTFRERLERAS